MPYSYVQGYKDPICAEFLAPEKHPFRNVWLRFGGHLMLGASQPTNDGHLPFDTYIFINRWLNSL